MTNGIYKRISFRKLLLTKSNETQIGKNDFVQHNNFEQRLNTSFMAILYQKQTK